MKKILLLFTFLAAFGSKAQPNEMLFDNTWYFMQMYIDGIPYNIPSNSELTNAVLEFTETPPYTFCLEVCRTLSGEIMYPNYDKLLFPNTITETGYPCSLNENIDFEAQLFNFFQGQIGIELSYGIAIVDFEPPNYWLNIHLPNGDFVEFTELPNPVLSANSFAKKMFKVYPNPTLDRINVSNLNTLTISKIRVLSIEGRLLFETKEHFVVTNHLSKGIYLLELIAEDGSKQVEKIIKE